MRPPSSGVLSPLLVALLRAVAFLGITEAVFYRLLPDPIETSVPSFLVRVHHSVNEAGRLAFQLGFIFVVLALVNLSYRTMRNRVWPAGLNGFLAVSFLSLCVLGISAAALTSGPAFGIAFLALSLLVLVFLAMHSYSVSDTTSARTFAVVYTAAVLCSCGANILEFAAWPAQLPDAMVRLQQQVLSGGRLLLWLSSVAAFLAFFDMDDRRPGSRAPRRAAVSIAAIVSAAFAAGSLLAPARLALLGGDAGAGRVFLLSTALFLSAATAGANLLDPRRRRMGFGLLLLILAGYPLRIAHQNMLMVLGAAVLMAPRPVPGPLDLLRMWVPASGPAAPRT